MTSTLGALTAIVMGLVAVMAAFGADAADERDWQAVAALDTEFQAAVKRHDVAVIERILHQDHILILGDGRVVTREDELEQARKKAVVFEQQDEEPGSQTVRVWGDTAVVTAKLWIKGTRDGVPFERKLWFSDTYVRTKSGWKYAFGQASLPLPQ